MAYIPGFLFIQSYIATAGAFHWRSMSNNMTGNWDRRAAYLNTQPVPGLLFIFPHGTLPSLEIATIVMTVLQVDLQSLCTSIYSSVKRVLRTDFNKVVVFGNERVILQL